MKPLATPVLGGMVSSLGLVLIVTPVIFTGCASAISAAPRPRPRATAQVSNPGRRWGRPNSKEEDNMLKGLFVALSLGL